MINNSSDISHSFASSPTEICGNTTSSSCSNSDIHQSAHIMASMKSHHSDSDGGGGGSSDEDSDNSIPEQPKRKRPQNDKSLKEKNKEHARNTRLRKKNFIDHLKQAIQDLGRERDEDELRLRSELTRIASEMESKKQVLQTFFYFRACQETDQEKWSTILSKDFYMTTPITPYRIFSPAEVVCGIRCLQGTDALICDTASLHTMVQALATRHSEPVRVQYFCGSEDMVCSGNVVMCRWVMKTENAVECGANFEVFKQGMMTAVFNTDGTLDSVELVYDVMSFMQQLRRASQQSGFQVIPNTLNLVVLTNNDCPQGETRIIFEHTSPYNVMFATQNWKEVTDIDSENLVGHPCPLLTDGENNSHHWAEQFRSAVKHQRSSYAVCTLPTSNKKFFVRIFPLYDDSSVTHFLALVREAVLC